MPRFKIMRFLSGGKKKVFRCSSREEESSKASDKSSFNDIHRRHGATSLTHTNIFRRRSSQDSYRSSNDFTRNESSSTLGSDGWGSRSISESSDPNQDVPSSSPSDQPIARQLEIAATYAPVLERLGDDGLILLPPDDLDDSPNMPVPEPGLKMLVLFCPEDEMIGNLFLDYLRRAFPFVEAIDQWEGLYGSNEIDHWQNIVDTVSHVFVLMSQVFLDFAMQEGILSMACLEMELNGTKIVPVYLEEITNENSHFFMDFENLWGISAQRNGFSTLHCWLKRSLVRHFTSGCPRY